VSRTVYVGDRLNLCVARPPTIESKQALSEPTTIEPLHLTPEITPVELLEAELKTDEKKEAAAESQSAAKEWTVADKIINRLWYKKPVSDEGDALDELGHRQGIVIGQVEKKIIAPDIDTVHVNSTDKSSAQLSDTKVSTPQKPPPAPSWVHDQVYGDKVSVG
jgi:hypothetical protein